MDNIGTELRPKVIGILPVSGFALMSYASTVEPFRAANLLSRQEIYRTVNLGIDMENIASSGAAIVRPDAVFSDAEKLDYVFVVAGGDPSKFDNRRVFSWLARLARQGTVIGGVSGGPVILARAGLMGGRRMTVHWEHVAALAEISPHLLIERTLYVIDRDRVTCAGGTAAMDLVHALIAQHHGTLFARRVSDWFLHTEIRPSEGPQRGRLVDRIGTTNAAVLDAVNAMEHHLSEPLSQRQLASVSGVSMRQLNRLFSEKLNRPTMRFYRELRLEKAHNLLRNSSLSLTEISLATGFSSSSHFSRAFSDSYGRPPSSFR